MRFNRKTRRLARKLIQDGWTKFVGDGLTVEISFPVSGPQNIDDSGQPIRLWRQLGIILPPEIIEKPTDYATSDIKGKPGSQERIESLKHYVETHHEKSPFTRTDDDILDAIMRVVFPPKTLEIVSLSPLEHDTSAD